MPGKLPNNSRRMHRYMYSWGRRAVAYRKRIFEPRHIVYTIDEHRRRFMMAANEAADASAAPSPASLADLDDNPLGMVLAIAGAWRTGAPTASCTRCRKCTECRDLEAAAHRRPPLTSGLSVCRKWFNALIDPGMLAQALVEVRAWGH